MKNERNDPKEPAVLPFLIVSHLLLIHLKFSFLCLWQGLKGQGHSPLSSVDLYLSGGIVTHFESLQVTALMFCTGTESGRLLLSGSSLQASQ